MNKVNINIPKESQELFAQLKNQYNPEESDLRKYQLHLLKTLKEFDALCREHGIVYYLAYGTLLGAVRHKGFIPWDDDADLWMDRENYAKLEKLMKGEYRQLTENVYVVNGIRPELWSPPYAYIDIFVLDKVPLNKTFAFLKEKLAKLMYALVKCRGKIDSKNFGLSIVYLLLSPLALLHSAVKWKEIYSTISQWPKNSQRCDSHTLQIYNNCFSYIAVKYPSSSEIWQPIEMEFEDHWFYVPKGYEDLLQKDYGDYMAIPKEENRLVHGDSVDIGGKLIVIGK